MGNVSCAVGHFRRKGTYATGDAFMDKTPESSSLNAKLLVHSLAQMPGILHTLVLASSVVKNRLPRASIFSKSGAVVCLTLNVGWCITGNIGKNLVKNILRLRSRNVADNGVDSLARRDD
jgi:hypothetical protein